MFSVCTTPFRPPCECVRAAEQTEARRVARPETWCVNAVTLCMTPPEYTHAEQEPTGRCGVQVLFLYSPSHAAWYSLRTPTPCNSRLHGGKSTRPAGQEYGEYHPRRTLSVVTHAARVTSSYRDAGAPPQPAATARDASHTGPAAPKRARAADGPARHTHCCPRTCVAEWCSPLQVSAGLQGCPPMQRAVLIATSLP